MSDRIRVMLVDDHQLVLDGLAALLSLSDEISVVGTAHDGLGALQLFERHSPDVSVVDLRMRPMDGVELTTRIRSRVTRRQDHPADYVRHR